MKRLARAGLSLATILIAAAGGVALWSPLSLAEWMREPRASLLLSQGINPDPVRLLRPGAAALSAMAMLGKDIFYDPGLSSSGRLSCASCHDARQAYGPSGALPAMLGGPSLMQQGMRAVPSLMYLERQPNFSIGPDNAENENVNIAAMAAQGAGMGHAAKSALTSAAANLVPQGGLFWDGRADTLQNQAMSPLTSPFEMDGGSITVIAAKLARAPYAAAFVQLFGPGIFADPQQAVAEALFAVARYQIEDPGFHPYGSKYDAWLEGKARLDTAELRGYLAFNDPAKGNCAACHLDRPGADGLPPLFTDHQFEALGVPRNPALAANRDPRHFDLGLCGRDDMKAMPQYCGLFGTPTLRNAAMRRVFFHNGIYRTLAQVLDFYNFRGPQPEKIYPRTAIGALDMFNDLPPRYRANIDSMDAPLAGKPGDTPAMTAPDESDIIAFLGTLTDGYLADGYRADGYRAAK